MSMQTQLKNTNEKRPIFSYSTSILTRLFYSVIFKKCDIKRRRQRKMMRKTFLSSQTKMCWVVYLVVTWRDISR